MLLSPPRSYSTVVAHMLGRHPQLHALAENALLFHSGMDEWRDRCLDRAPFGAGARRDVAALLFGGLDEAALDAADELLRSTRGSTTELVSSLAAAVSPRVLVDKSPLELTPYDTLVGLVDRWPDARFLHLTRHPCTSVASMIEFPTARAWAQGAMEAMAPLMWWAAHQNATTLERGLPAGRFLRVRGEDAVNDPSGVLGPVLEAWGFRSDADALATLLSSDAASIAERPDLGGGDPSFLASPALRRAPEPPSRLLPDEAVSPPALSRRIAELARSFGYDVGEAQD